MSDRHRHGTADCRAIFERLSEYIDGELPAGLCDRLEGHMDDCPPCQVFLESLRRTIRLTEALPEERAPEEARRMVVEAYEKLRRGEADGAGLPERAGKKHVSGRGKGC